MSHIPAGERRRQIIEVAARVIAREGVAKATTRRIGAASKANIGTLHYTFGSKSELLDATFEYCWDLAAEIIDTAFDVGGGPSATVRGLLTGYAELAIADPDLIAAQYQLLSWGITQEGGRTAQVAGVMTRLDGLILDALRGAEWAAGLSVSHERLARMLGSLLDGILLRFIVTRSETDCRDDVETAIELLEAAFVTRVDR